MADRLESYEQIVTEISAAFEENNYQQAVEIFLDLHPNDQVEVFDDLSDNEKDEILKRIDILTTAQLFSLQEDQDTLEAAESLSIDRLADVLDEMAPDEAADLLLDLPPDQAAQALEKMEETEDVLPLLEYPDETAGGRMTTEFIAISTTTSAAEAIDQLRELDPDSNVPYYIFVIDIGGKLVGVTGLRELVVCPAVSLIQDIMDPEVISVEDWTDQEQVARVMITYDLAALPVVTSDNQLVGVITHDDILDVLQEEATEDIYRLSNVSDFELEPESPVNEQLKGRLPWLFLNTGTALFAAWVISNFEGIIAQVATLAVSRWLLVCCKGLPLAVLLG
jgi:magnesium transporter